MSPEKKFTMNDLWIAQYELELQNGIRSNNQKLIDSSKKTLAKLKRNY